MNNKLNRYGTETIPFSAAVPSDSLLFVSGQGGFDPDYEGDDDGDIESQTERTILNIANILSQSGLTLADILKANVYLTDRKNYEVFNQVYARLFPRPFPARTLIYCELNFGLLVEIDVIARRRSPQTLTEQASETIT